MSGWEIDTRARARRALHNALADVLAAIAFVATIGLMYYFGGMHP